MKIREKKKIRTQNQILEAAEGLFRKNGFEATTIEQIAERAEVATGTLYNYFESKDHMLVRLISSHARRTLDEGRRIAEGAHSSPVQALRQLLLSYLENFYSRHPRKLLSQALATALLHPETTARDFLDVEEQLIGQITELIEKLKVENLLSSALPAKQSALLIYSTFYSLVLIYLQDEETTLQQLDRANGSNLELLLKKWSIL